MTSTISKTGFARLKNVSPARVSQWLSEGKLKPDALEGDGRNARIKVDVANAQLKKNLDLRQRFSNGLATRLDAVAPIPVPMAAAELDPTAPQPSLPLSSIDIIEEQFKREKLEILQRENRKGAEEEAARAGRYVDAKDVAVQMAKLVAQTVTVFDGGIPEVASALAAKFSIPQRDVLHAMRQEFRAIRQKAASSIRDGSASLPETIETETPAPVLMPEDIDVGREPQ
jgi:hypothetical protein